jgi:hypothetical protein
MRSEKTSDQRFGVLHVIIVERAGSETHEPQLVCSFTAKRPEKRFVLPPIKAAILEVWLPSRSRRVERSVCKKFDRSVDLNKDATDCEKNKSS